MMDLQRKAQQDAEAFSRQAEVVASARNARIESLVLELARRYHGDLVERQLTIVHEQQELGKELQETQHELLVLDQVKIEPGNEDAHDARAGVLASRERRLKRQKQQVDENLDQLNKQLRKLIAHDAAQIALALKAEHNKLVREREAKKAELLKQMHAVDQEYDGPIGAAQQQLFELSALTPVDLEHVQGGLYRE